MVHNIFLCGYAAQTASPLSLGTADSYGIEQLQVTTGEGWDGLAVTATFHPPAGEPVRLLVPMDGLLDVPPEATKSAGRLAHGRIVFVGTADGVQRISCNVSYSLLPHAEVGGSESTSTPSMDAQVLAEVAAARKEMEKLREQGAGSFGGGGAQPDWNQNDPNASNYVKNRPLYDSRKLTELETILEHTDVVGGLTYSSEVSTALVVGDTYIVECAGKTYECIAKQADKKSAYLGNLWHSNEWGDANTGEDFFYGTAVVDGGAAIWNSYCIAYALGTASLKITHCKKEGELHTEPKYIPNSVWLEQGSTELVYDNYDLGTTDEGFYVSKEAPGLLNVGDTVHIAFADPIEGYSYPNKVSYDLFAVPYRDGMGNVVGVCVENPDWNHRIIWECNFCDGKLILEGNAFRKVSLSITKNTVKTNCDLVIRITNEAYQLVSGDFATAKAKLKIGMIVSAFVFVDTSWPEEDGDPAGESTACEVCYAYFEKEGTEERIIVPANCCWLVVYPDNTVE